MSYESPGHVYAEETPGTTTEDIARIAVPDGHLERDLRPIFRRMGLPYPKVKSGDTYQTSCVYETHDEKKQKVEMHVMRPLDSPGCVRDGHFIAAISGLDCWIDALGIDPTASYDRKKFQKALNDQGLTQLLNLYFRPSSVILAVRDDLPVTTKQEFEERYSNGHHVGILGSEFHSIPKLYADGKGVKVKGYKHTTGKTESLLGAGIADAIIDIAETGNSVGRNNGRIIGGIIPKTTPRMIVRSEALQNGHEHFLVDFADRLHEIIDEMRGEKKYQDHFKTNDLQEKLLAEGA